MRCIIRNIFRADISAFIFFRPHCPQVKIIVYKHSDIFIGMLLGLILTIGISFFWTQIAGILRIVNYLSVSSLRSQKPCCGEVGPAGNLRPINLTKTCTFQ